VTEELDNSLRQTIETYLDTRLQAIDEQLSRLQSDFNEAFARLREVSAIESLDATPVAAAIAAHLQAAREQKLSGVTAATASARELSLIKRSVAEIEKQQTHADVLRTLLTSAVQFAERAALFVIKNEQAIGWQVCEAGDATNIGSIRGVAFPLTAETLLGQAVRSGSAWAGVPGSNSEDSRLIEQLGGEPRNLAAVPLIARGKVVAVLYADTALPDPSAIKLDALELLTRVAGMAVNLVSAPPSAPEKHAGQSHAAPVAQPVAAVQPIESETISEPEPGYVPQIEPATPADLAPPIVEGAVTQPIVAEKFAEPVVEEAVAEPVTEVGAEFTVEERLVQPVVEEVAAEAEPQLASEQEPAIQDESTPAEMSVEAEPLVEAEPASQPAPAVAPSFASHYATPLGTARRYGVTEPDLPIEVGEEERRLHNDARRFARLLVSEIKLYNEQQVKEGRSENNLYDRLRDDIDRSRQMYDKRVAPPVAARHDYFHQELVNTLAEGDAAKLGAGYPGASVAVG
jgi:hypothetical protein